MFRLLASISPPNDTFCIVPFQALEHFKFGQSLIMLLISLLNYFVPTLLRHGAHYCYVVNLPILNTFKLVWTGFFSFQFPPGTAASKTKPRGSHMELWTLIPRPLLCLKFIIWYFLLQPVTKSTLGLFLLAKGDFGKAFKWWFFVRKVVRILARWYNHRAQR